MKKYILIAAMAASAFVTATSAANALQGCKFYERRYMGDREVMFMPKGQRAQLPSRVNDNISAVNCTSRCTAMLYADKNYKGTSFWVKDRVLRLPDSIHDKASSAKVSCN